MHTLQSSCLSLLLYLCDFHALSASYHDLGASFYNPDISCIEEGVCKREQESSRVGILQVYIVLSTGYVCAWLVRPSMP